MDEKINCDYTFVKGKAEDDELEQYRQCFARNGTERQIQNLRWLHQQNLATTNTIYYAMCGDTVAAIYTALPVKFVVNQQQVTALQSIDTITDAEHRGKGLFPKLANKLFENAPEEGFEFVYGFPNENSAPGFFKKLKWISFGEAPFLLKPLRLTYFFKKFINKSKSVSTGETIHHFHLPQTEKIAANFEIRQLDHFDDNYNELWAEVAKGIGVAVDRSSAYMNWRFVDKPGEQYSKCGIFLNGQLKGIVVFTVKNKHNGRIGYVMELIYDQNTPKLGVLLLRYARKIFQREKVDAVLAWCFPHSFNYPSFIKSGYLNLPVKLRPQHLYLGVRSFREATRHTVENIGNWYISYCDSDTV